jgi:ABC-type phosphate/phosphonate transport system substrate-binding protein
MNKNLPVLMLVMILSLLWGCGGKEGELSGKDDTPIRIGYMICNSLEETRHRFEPLTAYLSEKTGRKFESIYVNTFDFEDLVKDKKVDFTHTNSILPIIFQEGYGLELLAIEERGRHGHQETGTIISLKESGIKTFDDMRGKTMVFGPALAPFGYMAQYYLMLENGFDPEEDLAYYAIPWGSYKHDKVVYGVLFGRYDVGAAPRLDFDRMARQGKIKSADFHIIAESIPMPY